MDRHENRQILGESTFMNLAPIFSAQCSFPPVSGVVGISLGIITTLIRFLIRLVRRTRLWYDDLFAFLGLVSLVIIGVVGKMYALSGKIFRNILPMLPRAVENGYADHGIVDRSTTPQHLRVALYYIPAVTFDTTIW